MKSLKNISKKDATLLLKALNGYSQVYYEFKNGKWWNECTTDTEEEVLRQLTEDLADKIGLDPEAGY